MNRRLSPIRSLRGALVTIANVFAPNAAHAGSPIAVAASQPSPAYPLPGSVGTAPRFAVVCVDASPSMESSDWPPTRLAAARDASKAYVQRLAREEPDASVAVVSYADSATLACPPTPASQYATIAAAIDRIAVGNGTNITSSLEIALKLLPARRLCQVIVLSDGHHNCGPKPTRLVPDLRSRAIVECVGIGGRPRDVDEKLMKTIASSYPDGTKRYRWIGDPQRLVAHFHNLGGGISRQ